MEDWLGKFAVGKARIWCNLCEWYCCAEKRLKVQSIKGGVASMGG
jgi:hypothetical protein